MADPIYGPYTSDNVPAEQLRTEFEDSTAMYNAEARDFRTELCKTTTDNTVRQRQRSMRFLKSGQDTTTPDMEHQDYQEITLTDPSRYMLRAGMTSYAWELENPSSGTLREIHNEALASDRRLSTQIVLESMLTDGGWYDAAMTEVPPPFAMNTFLTTHDHYLAYNVSGVPAYAHWTAGKRNVQEHGFGISSGGATQLVSFINGAQAEEIENVADWVDTTERMDTALLETLQRMGLTPSFMVAGIPVVKNDWIPENYMTIFDPGEKICRWKVTDNPVTENLMVHMQEDNAQYHGVGTYVRWGSSKVVLRGAGVSIYLGGASWTDATGWET